MSLPVPNPAINLTNIQDLADEPNDTQGLTPALLKARYDQFGADWMNYWLNHALPQIATLQDLINLTLGQVPNRSLTGAKIALASILGENMANAFLALTHVPDDLLTEAKMAAALKKKAGGVAPFNFLSTQWIDIDPQDGSAVLTYVDATHFTIVGDYRSVLRKSTRWHIAQSHIYTNDPAPGSNIVLNMTDTSGFNVGNYVYVYSSAGTEKAKITAIVANTSITVDTLALDHTQSGKTVVCHKYFFTTTDPTYNTGTNLTTVTVCGGGEYTLGTGYLSDWAAGTLAEPDDASKGLHTAQYSNAENPVGYPSSFKWLPTSLTGFSGTPNLGAMRIRSNGGRFNVFRYYDAADLVGGTSNNAAFTIVGLPVVPTINARYFAATIDAGGPYSGSIVIAAASNVMTLGKTAASGDFSTSGAKSLYSCDFWYE